MEVERFNYPKQMGFLTLWLSGRILESACNRLTRARILEDPCDFGIGK